VTDVDAAATRRAESLLVAGDGVTSWWSALLTAVVLVAAFGAAAGPLGAAAGLTTALVWYTLGTPYAIAAGHVLLVALYPGDVDPLAVVVVEAAFVTLLLAPLIRTAQPFRLIALTLSTAGLLGAIAWLTLESQSLWLAAALTVGALALGVYGWYRYGLVALGLVDDDRTHETTDDT
jgi:hypothetical protein